VCPNAMTGGNKCTANGMSDTPCSSTMIAGCSSCL
jgi:hypothetical protein